MENETQRTEIASVGEFGLIRHLTQNFKLKQPSTITGIGDDAAVLQLGNKRTVVSTDLLVEGVHFDLMYVPLKHLGYKSIIVNLSDIYAMNGTPTQVLVSITASNRFSVEALSELYEGIYHACEKYKVDLVGGDTSNSLKGLVISVTVIGEVDENKLTLRSTAKEGDLLCVSGDLGAAYLGLQLLEREKRIFLENQNIQPNLEDQKYLVGKQLMPEARKDIVELLEKMEVQPTAMIDISDGLSSEILHICEDSKIGCRLYEDKIPIAEDTYNMALKFNLDPTTCALSGGEDYELLFTVAQTDFDKVKGNPYISVIGYMANAAEGSKLITKGNNIHDLKAQGWNQFPRESN